MDYYEIWIERTRESAAKQRSTFNGDAEMAVGWLRASADEIEDALSRAEDRAEGAHRAQAGRDTEDLTCVYPGCLLEHPHTGPAVLNGLRGAGWMS